MLASQCDATRFGGGGSPFISKRQFGDQMVGPKPVPKWKQELYKVFEDIETDLRTKKHGVEPTDGDVARDARQLAEDPAWADGHQPETVGYLRDPSRNTERAVRNRRLARQRLATEGEATEGGRPGLRAKGSDLTSLASELNRRRRQQRYNMLEQTIFGPLSNHIHRSIRSGFTPDSWRPGTANGRILALDFDLSELRDDPSFNEGIAHLRDGVLGSDDFHAFETVEKRVKTFNDKVEKTSLWAEEKAASRLKGLTPLIEGANAYSSPWPDRTLCFPYVLQGLWEWWWLTAIMDTGIEGGAFKRWPTRKQSLAQLGTGRLNLVGGGTTFASPYRWDRPWVRWGGTSIMGIASGDAEPLVSEVHLALAELISDRPILSRLSSLRAERSGVVHEMQGLARTAKALDRLTEEIRRGLYDRPCGNCP